MREVMTTFNNRSVLKLLELWKPIKFVLLALILFSCENENEKEGFKPIIDPSPPTTYLFKSRELTMWSDRKNVVVNSSTTISQKCTPLYSGKGGIFLLRGSQYTSVIDSPFVDTLDNSGGSCIYLKAEFVANQDFVARWSVRFLNPKEYVFDGLAYMDSLLINGKLYDL